MVNLFDNTNAPTLEPDQIVVGDRSVWRKTNLATTKLHKISKRIYSSSTTIQYTERTHIINNRFIIK